MATLVLEDSYAVFSRQQSDGAIDEEYEERADTAANVPSGVCYTYAKILTRFWFVVCILTFIIVTACAVVSFKDYDLPDFSNPSKGFGARGTLITSRVFSIRNLHRNHSLTTRPDYDIEASPPIHETRSKRQAKQDAISSVDFCSQISWFKANHDAVMVFEGVDGTNMLSTQAIKSVCRAEKRLVTSHPLYSKRCDCSSGPGLFPSSTSGRNCPTWSLGNYVALFANKTSCEDIVDDDVTTVHELLALCVPFYKELLPRGIMYRSCDAQLLPAAPDQCKQHSCAVLHILYYLLPEEFSRSSSTDIKMSSPIVAVILPIGLSSALKTIFQDSVSKRANSDGITKLKAVNFFIKLDLVSDLIFSDSIYLGLAGSAIFFIIWIYTGSFWVTLAAMLNMVFSLTSAYFFYKVVYVRKFFPFGNIMAVILVLGIGADDTFVYMDLWKKSKIEIGDGDLPRLVYETLRHAALTMLVTSLTTAAALFVTVISSITAVKCFAVFAGTAVIMNLVFTLTLLPSVIVMQHKLSVWCCSSGVCLKIPSPKCTALKNLFNFLSKFHKELIPFLIVKLKYPLILFFILLMAGGAVVIFYAPRFRPPEKSFQFFVDSHYFEQYDFIYRNQFSYSKEPFRNSEGSIVWGVQAVDNGDTWVPPDSETTGTVLLDNDFEFSSEEAQKWLLDFCQSLRNQSFFQAHPQKVCFIEKFVDFMRRESCTDQNERDLSPCCNHASSIYTPALFNKCLVKFASQSYSGDLYFRRSDLNLAAMKVEFLATYPRSFNFSRNDEYWMEVNTWVEDKLKMAPNALQRGWFVSDSNESLYYDLQQSLSSGSEKSVLVTLAIATGILFLSIQNILLALWAMLTVTSAVFVTVATLVLLGWELNVVEATIITLAVGLSIDFAIHYGVAYKLAPSKDRRHRTQYSITTMTPAISIAAFSTFIAGALVLPSTLLTYHQFGIFLMLVMSISWVHATFFFQSLCMVMGPQGSCGDIPCPKWCEWCRCGEPVHPPHGNDVTGRNITFEPFAVNVPDEDKVV